MKFVWTIILLLLVGALVVVFDSPAPTRENAASREAEDALLEEAANSVMEPTIVTPTPLTIPVTPSQALANELNASVEERAATQVPERENTDGASAVDPSAPRTPANDLAIGKPVAIAEGKLRVIPSKFERLPDGAIVADDVWKITGDGTAENPYLVSWEFLASAGDTYTPRVNDFGFPERILLLHGKYVRVAGYLAFPLVAPTSSECLVMLNQWDGCCIGVPPTPYDAVEVKLVAPMPRSRKHSMAYGTVEGLFEVDPYIVESWLVGLYMIKDSTVEQGL